MLSKNLYRVFLIIFFGFYSQLCGAHQYNKLLPVTAIKADLFRASIVAYRELNTQKEKIDISKYYLVIGHGSNNAIVVGFMPMAFLWGTREWSLNSKVFWIESKTFTVKSDMKKEWYNTESVIQGDLFLAAYLSSLDIIDPSKPLTHWEYNVIVGYLNNDITVEFELQFSDERSAVFDERSIYYEVNKKNFTVISRNRGNSGEIVVRSGKKW